MNLHEAFKLYVDEHLISVQQDGDLFIYNYTQKCQWERHWDEYTRMCRGLILDKEGNIIARPFKKFFGLGEHEETKRENLSNEIPEVSEKLDGSMGILFKYNGIYRFATRGSFQSDQAIEANKIFKEKYSNLDLTSLDDYTVLFEIIYPQNRVVIDYKGIRDLFVIGMVYKENGMDLPYSEVAIRAHSVGLKSTYYTIKSLDNAVCDIVEGIPDKEGYVLRYKNGLRVKIKTEEYKRLHKLLTGVSEKDIWELITNKTNIQEYIEKVPDEFHEWFKSVVREFHLKYNNILNEAIESFRNKPDTNERKTNAIYFISQKKYLHSILFNMFDNCDYEYSIWKQLKPSGAKTFKMIISE